MNFRCENLAVDIRPDAELISGWDVSLRAAGCAFSQGLSILCAFTQDPLRLWFHTSALFHWALQGWCWSVGLDANPSPVRYGSTERTPKPCWLISAPWPRGALGRPWHSLGLGFPVCVLDGEISVIPEALPWAAWGFTELLHPSSSAHRLETSGCPPPPSQCPSCPPLLPRIGCGCQEVKERWGLGEWPQTRLLKPDRFTTVSWAQDRTAVSYKCPCQSLAERPQLLAEALLPQAPTALGASSGKGPSPRGSSVPTSVQHS